MEQNLRPFLAETPAGRDAAAVDDLVFAKREWEAGGPLFPALATSGGHTGFLERSWGRWHERHTVRFFDDILARP